MKKLTNRLEKAVTKLYTAFHEGTLNSNDCTACAVGNICNDNGHWSYLLGDNHGTGILRKTNVSNIDYIETGKEAIKDTEYSAQQILNIEKTFLEGTNFKVNEESYSEEKGFKETKEEQYQGLCNVVAYLCKLDGIENVMDIQSLFEFNQEDNTAVRELAEILLSS